MDDNEIKRRLAGRAAEYMMFKDDEEDTEVPADITSTGNVIVFPDFEKSKNEVERMRTELSMLLLELDELQFVICKNIETEYMLKLGSIEYRAYEAQCLSLRLKRKIELIQAKKNRQEKVIISAIEETLDTEFAEYQKQLNEQIDKMNDALKRSKAEVLTNEENKELYKRIIESLKVEEENFLLPQLDKKEINGPFKNEEIVNLINKDLLNIENQEDLDRIIKVLFLITRSGIILALKNNDTKKAKSEYIKMIDYIKYGALKRKREEIK